MAVGKNLESLGEMLVNEAEISVMSLCLFSVLDASEAFKLFSLPRDREYASFCKTMCIG